MGKDKKSHSDNFCVVCGRPTNDKKIWADAWTNQFFICNVCKKVWCGSCMGAITTKGPSKTWKLGKRGIIKCPDCGTFIPMLRLPKNLPFKQERSVVKSSVVPQFTNNKTLAPSSAEKKRENIQIFMSYATKDENIFRIRDIAENLKGYKEINEVLYWQKDNKDNIIEYMNDNLSSCDALLLFCSPNSLDSEPVKKEWTAAEKHNKPIIPIFTKTEYIPFLLSNREGIEYDPFDFDNNIQRLFDLTMKKI